MDDRMVVQWVPIGELIPAEYNPRGLTKEEKKHLRKSLEEFGMVEPLVVNSAPERRNVIIGGHQRLYVLGEMGWEDIPVVYLSVPDLRRERELNLRLNKNQGHFDFDLLADFDQDLLEEVGFSDKEIEKIFDLGDDPDDSPGEVRFTEELQEEHNYVVLYFENSVDWLRFESIYPLPTVKSLKSRPGWEQKGIGRVVNGTEFLDSILGDD
jgi:ParB-like nuclease domain